jgi:hypothetical protein
MWLQLSGFKEMSFELFFIESECNRNLEHDGTQKNSIQINN